MVLKWVQSFIGSSYSLRRKVLKSSNYMMFSSVGIALADSLKTAVFARVLLVNDYGMMSLAVMVVGILESFTTLGINLMVQRDGEDFLERLPVYWTIKSVRGVLLTGLVWVVAPLVAEYYDEPDLVWIIRILGFSFIFRGLTGFGIEVCQKQMRFGRVALAEGLVALISLGFGIIFLFWFGNVWSLVAYNLAKGFLLLLTSYLLFPWRPRVHLDRVVLRGAFSFGGAISLVFMANYFMSSFERGVLGKIVGVEVVGYYSMAHFLAYAPVLYLANIIAPIFLPSFTQIAHDPVRLRRAFFKALGVYITVFLGIAGLLFVGAEYAILIMYGEKWLPALPTFRILILFGFFKAIVTLYPSIFLIKNRPWLMAGVTVLSAAVFGGLCIPFTAAMGIAGTAWSLVIASAIPPVLGLVIIEYLLTR
jgi:O-antigen/teichoic acid export membrane protein